MRQFLFFLCSLCLGFPCLAQARLVGDLPRRGDAPLHQHEGLESEYGQVRTSEGTRLRTILTRPVGTRSRLPAIFLAQAVSCGSLDIAPGRPSALMALARRSGMVLVRVERSGTGDSEGVDCSQLDYDTEIRHYREALGQIGRHPWIDPRRILLYGSSLGSTTAPLIAQGFPVAGIFVQGGGARTYVERMIEFDRLHLERSGLYSPEQIHGEMLRRIAFHHEYLVRGRTPAQIEAERPDLKGVWGAIRGTEADSHYGRPLAWHQQAAKHNFLAAWARIEAPVLVLYGEYDQFERRDGHRLIVETVNRLRPGSARFVEIAGVDHSLISYADADSAYREESGERNIDLFLTPVMTWLREIAAPQRAGVSRSSRPPEPRRSSSST
jgi:pimeloyl-ACP methyl ester carboxylesterase